MVKKKLILTIFAIVLTVFIEEQVFQGLYSAIPADIEHASFVFISIIIYHNIFCVHSDFFFDHSK